MIGVLAVQGAFAAHVRALEAIGLDAIEVRTAGELARCDGLVLPGGESTVQLGAIEREPGLEMALNDLVRSGAPVLATCAGLILAARTVRDPDQRSFGWIDVAVRRNGWGRQLHSAETIADDGRTPVVLIRAPRIDSVGERASIELTVRGEPVLVREGAVWGATFHPELSATCEIHARAFAPRSALESQSSQPK